MKVEIKMSGNDFGTCKVNRESGDPKFYGVRNAAGESKLFHHMKAELKKQGFNFIKKRMHKDGHMVDEMQQYLRERKADKNGRRLAIYNSNWAINGAEVDFNQGEVILSVADIGSKSC